MARPGSFYRGGGRSGWILTLLLTVVAALVLFAAWLFLDLQNYLIYEKDGVRLVLPGDQDGTTQGEEAAVKRELPLIDVEIVVEKTDYTAVRTDAGASLQPLRGRYLQAASVTSVTLGGYLNAGLGQETAMALELKPESGLLCYHSGVAQADSYAVNGELELEPFVQQLREQDIWMVAVISCLVDGTMAVRNSPIALKDGATGGVFVRDGLTWLDPYNSGTRAYLGGLVAELADMGFDEILLTGLWLPDGVELEFTTDMAAASDPVSAVSSLGYYLRNQADSLGVRLSAALEPEALRDGTGEAIGQDPAVFLHLFDRVLLPERSAQDQGALAKLEGLLTDADSGETRIVAMISGAAPERGSYLLPGY